MVPGTSGASSANIARFIRRYPHNNQPTVQAMSEVSLDAVYSEIQELKKEITLIKRALIPEEKISAREMEELGRIKRKMEAGERKKLEDVLAGD